jgi:hypothetical protein
MKQDNLFFRKLCFAGQEGMAIPVTVVYVELLMLQTTRSLRSAGNSYHSDSLWCSASYRPKAREIKQQRSKLHGRPGLACMLENYITLHRVTRSGCESEDQRRGLTGHAWNINYRAG